MRNVGTGRSGEVRVEDFTPELDATIGDYRVRFARTEEERQALYRLRFEVFNVELGEGLSESWDSGLDEDRFDPQCQHLMVHHVPTGKVVGTYRLQVAEVAERREGFYTATEFDLEALPAEVRAEAMEAGRACIVQEHRCRPVLFLLWRGLAAYVLWNRKRYFFGCCSLPSQEPELGLRTLGWLERRGHVSDRFRVSPLAAYACEVPEGADVESEEGVKIPPLFQIYLRYGAQVCGPPAIDRFFGTIDFLACLDVSQVDPRVFASFAGK
jgi:putative hemolysin